MTTISPTRVSMYDFLYQDTQPMVSLLADTANLSLPQAKLALGFGLQAIVSALLAYQQRHQGAAVSKKLFSRSAVKELRKYNSMNFATINATLYYRTEIAEAIFGDNARVNKASEYIATLIEASVPQAQTLLTCLCVIVLRELAILADYSQLDNDELDKWFGLQPQFLSKQRFLEPSITEPLPAEIAHSDSPTKETDSTELSTESGTSEITPPVFDPYWYELTNFKPEHNTLAQDMQQATPNYLKAIGRSSKNAQQGHHNDMLVFAQMPAIALPHQRWLLQLAKISDIYLSRKRLRLTSEPVNPPTRPLVSLKLIEGSKDDKPTTTSEKPIEYDKPRPLWKDPVILAVILVIGVLSVLALIKYQVQQSNSATSAPKAVLKQDQIEERAQQDVAIVKVEDDSENDENIENDTSSTSAATTE